MSFRKSFFKNVLIAGGYNYAAQVLNFASTFITARLLLPETFGLVGLIIVFTGFITVFSDSGVSLAIIKSPPSRLFYKSVDTMAFYMGLILFAITALLAYPIALFYRNSSLVLPTFFLGTTFLFKSMGIVRAGVLSKGLQFSYLGKVVLVNMIINISITVVMALSGAGYWSLIVPQIVVAILPIFQYERKVHLGFKLYPWRYVKVAVRRTRSVVGNLIGFNFVNYWSRNSDNLLVGKMYGTADLGIYSRAYSLLQFPLSLITGVMSTVLYPSLNKHKETGGAIEGEYFFVMKVISVICFPISLILIMFPDVLVHYLWGDNWKKVAELLPFFGILILSQPMLSTVGNILILEGKERSLMLSGWVGSIFLITGIVIGANISLLAIAKYYSLGFLLLVLPFNITYIYIKSLGFTPKTVLMFWCPVLLTSLLLWVACVYNRQDYKWITLSLVVVQIGFGLSTEFQALKRNIQSLVLKYIP